MRIQPKPYMEKIKVHDKPYGTAARRLANMRILEKGTPLPKTVEYEDIDTAFYEWVDKRIEITHEGKRLPTYKLFSTQRISEYSQTWSNLDDSGSLLMNFKTVTREPNPSKGEMYGGGYNIPGHPMFSLFYVPVLEDNGTEAYDKYMIRQPSQVNFSYSVSIITNKYELLNEMNSLMQYEFNAINCYIAPNGHAMPMTLDSVSDESEYAIDDRKYYSQTFLIKVKGYIIREEDITVERIPSRIHMSSNDSDSVGKKHKRKPYGKRKRPTVDFIDLDWRDYPSFKQSVLDGDPCDTPPLDGPNNKYETSVEFVEDYEYGHCEEETPPKYVNVAVKITITMDDCTDMIEFITEKEVVIDSIETENIGKFTVRINGEEASLDEELHFMGGDRIEVSVTRENLYKGSEIVMGGYDPNNVFERVNNAETVIDEQVTEEDYVVE